MINDFEEKNWRYDKFENFIWDNIAETALSEKERKSLIARPFSILREAAQKLRLTDKETDEKGKGSEIAEIVLYGIMRHHFNALPVVPKIFYKQNRQDNAKGSDSVHIVVDQNNNFTIWMGEAKFFNNIEDSRLYEIVNSVSESLAIEKLKKENSIITSVSDINELDIDAGVKERIKKILDKDQSIDNLKPILNVPILLLHECLITRSCQSLSQEYKDEIINFHKQRAESYFKKQKNKISHLNLYTSINFHIILFPVPEKDKIVNTFITTVENLRG